MMPSTSAKQAKFMRAVAHSPKFAKKVGVPQSVGKDFEMADKKKTKKFGDGGTAKKPMMESDRKPIDTRRSVLGSDKDIIARGNRTPYEPIPKTGPDAPKRKPLGRAGAAGYKSGGDVMVNKGITKKLPTAKQMGSLGMKEGAKVMKKSDKAGRALVKKSADTMGRAMKMNKGGKCYAGGGLVAGHKSADGIAKKGKTKGKMC